jgi:hypothetical protein
LRYATTSCAAHGLQPIKTGSRPDPLPYDSYQLRSAKTTPKQGLNDRQNRRERRSAASIVMPRNYQLLSATSDAA